MSSPRFDYSLLEEARNDEQKEVSGNFVRISNQPPVLMLNHFEEDDLFYLSDERGFILNHKQWTELKWAINFFYNEVSAEEVRRNNERVEQGIEERIEENKKKANQPKHDNTVPREEPGYVYLLEGNGWYKIGKAQEPINRSKTFTVKLPFEVELIHKIKTSAYSKLEKFLHRKFSNKRLNGEWFDLNQDDIEYIKNLDGGEYNEQG